MPVAAPPSSTELSRAREALDQWVRDLMQWHFSPETGAPFWLEWAGEGRLGSAPRGPRPTTTSTSSARSRTSGCAAARCGAGCRRATPDRPIYVFETGGSTGVPKSRINIDDFRIDYSHVQRHAARTSTSRRAPTGSSSGPPARGGCAWRSSTWRSIAAASASGRSRSALGDQADQEGRDRDGGALQAPRHRPGADAAQGARHHQVHVHHAQAARGAVRAHLAEEGRASPASSAAAPR